MKTRIVHFGLAAALCLMVLNAAEASSRRETPVVRAVRRAKAAVANIQSKKTAPAGTSLFSTELGSNDRQQRHINGMGTGIVIDERGYIATNYHVVRDVDSLRITLSDGSTYDGRIVAHDSRRDMAIVKIPTTRPLTVMPLGTSSDLMLGETVIAIGNAFGYEHTVTTGIISALSRDVEVNGKQKYENLIQTDASINPGNSGGPLLNLDGEVVGINVAIRAGAQRIGFAIPIDEARTILAELLSAEHLNTTRHGLKTKDVKSGDRLQLVVEKIEPNSPAEKAGFQPGDVIQRVGEVRIRDRADLQRALLGRGEESPMDIRINRDSEPKTLALKVTSPASNGDSAVVRANNGGTDRQRIWDVLGLRLRQLPAGEKHRVAPNYRGGMRVTAVRKGSPASANGIRRDDILVGLHIWETLSRDNIAYVLDHPDFDSFTPLKFYVIRDQQTLYGHLQLAAGNR